MGGGENVKKGFAFILTTFLFSAVPSVIHAQEIKSHSDSAKCETNVSHQQQKSFSNQPDTAKLVQGSSDQQSSAEIQAKPISGASINKLVPNNPSPSLSREAGSNGIEVSLPIIGKVNVNILPENGTTSDSGMTTSSKTGLLELGINNSKIIDNLNVNLLTSQQDNTGSEKKSAASIDLGNTHVGVIESSKNVSNDTQISSGGLLIANSKDSILGGIHLGIAEVTKIAAPNYQEINSSLINADTNSQLLGDNHLGLLEYHQKETDSVNTVSGGLVVIDSESPLGDTHIGLGEFNNKEYYNSNPNVPNGNSSTDVPQKPVVNNPDTNEKPAGSGSINPVQKADPDMNHTYQNKQPGLEDTSEEINSRDVKDKNKSVDELAKLIKDLGFETAANYHRNNAMDLKLSNLSQANNKTGNSDEQTMITLGSSVVGGGGLSSGSGGTASYHGGSGIDSLLDTGAMKEFTLNNYIHYLIKELSDEWIKAPPIKPPQTSFFLPFNK